MAEYIDREAVLKKMQNWNTKERLINCVEDAPAADVVEVVRCKDCKFFMQYPEKCADTVEHADGECWRKYFYSYNAQFSACEYNDYCSRGKRKDGE